MRAFRSLNHGHRAIGLRNGVDDNRQKGAVRAVRRPVPGRVAIKTLNGETRTRPRPTAQGKSSFRFDELSEGHVNC